METRPLIRRLTALVLILQLSGLPVHALISINDGKNQFFVVGTISAAWDSNIFANSTATGDYIYSASLGLEYIRRAGLITFNGSAFLDASQFSENRTENFENPRFRGEFNKQSGRTTGALTLGAARQSRADTAANIRSESWNYDAGLNLKYPVIERYTLSGGIGYSYLDFLNNAFLVDLRTYTANIDLFYIYTSERDLVGGYRIRWGETSASTSFVDHAFTAGVSGKILPKVGGNARAGYQVRIPSGSNEDSYQAFTASLAATWNATKRANLTIQGGKDFSTSSTNINIDGTSGNLDLQYGHSAKISAYAGTGYGINRFLGAAGAGRRDTYFTWNVGIGYTLSEHFKAMLTYSHYRNWSNVAFSDFKRNSVNLNLSSRF
jgi:hypothetical protein